MTDRSLGTARGEERKEAEDPNQSDVSDDKRFIKKIYIENNRFVQIQDHPILVEGNPVTTYEEYFIRIKDNRISNCGLESKLYAMPGATDEEKLDEKELVKQAFERIGGEPESCILLKNLFVYNLACSRNTISKGSGSGIKLYNVKGSIKDISINLNRRVIFSNDINRLVVRNIRLRFGVWSVSLGLGVRALWCKE